MKIIFHPELHPIIINIKKTKRYKIYLQKCFHALVCIQIDFKLKEALSWVILMGSRQACKEIPD